MALYAPAPAIIVAHRRLNVVAGFLVRPWVKVRSCVPVTFSGGQNKYREALKDYLAIYLLAF
jgi:hypothetical protein